MSAPLGSPTLPPSNPAFIHINLNPTLGALFIGVVLASILFGITTLQTIYYYQTYPKDRPWIKLLVAVLWALDGTSLALVTHGVYTYLVLDFANFEDAETIVWSLVSEPAVTSVIAFTVDCFLVHRIYALRKTWWPIAAILVVCAAVAVAIGIVTVWRSNTGSESISALPELRWMAITGGALSSSLDLTIALLMCYLLWRSQTAFESTNHMIQTIALYVIMSGLTPALLQWLTLITYLKLPAPGTLVFQLFTMIESKAYVNTLMAGLNSRQSVRDVYAHTSVYGFSGPVFRTPTYAAQTRDEDVDYPLEQFKGSGQAARGRMSSDTVVFEHSQG